MSALKGEAGLALVAFLERGWDSYGGDPITAEAIDAARRFMELLKRSEPHIVPCSNGGLQLEWHEGGFDCEIEVSPEGVVQPWEPSEPEMRPVLGI